ncbi:MAG: hypothetical protein A2928_03165 [Candidatus Taylorbacteria bacterium RIFCSPLOWO2_01_FULL_45_15b]|uniref:RND efflux pump membrane fusion protein barrel-sandwich domain-containing protein n=1 Tax=Candidatus Taylorbacteria bacterium RIFCSPLOWO2_01_FULL_45_15b TaxID=1802319 RepID=A0A1G2NFL6_9BACT|nr:MAG: hypothetical protein A2928_03165 [Candidatus Taylorbacteria bacterium RIFCSPLOWO2_01_FULL_45_15b]
MKAIFGRHKALVFFVAVIFAAVIFGVFGRGDKIEETIFVQKSDIRSVVSVTGRVAPAAEVDLSFEKTGRVTSVRSEIGSSVFAGQIILSISAGDIFANKSQAEARLATEEARLLKIKMGAKPEEIAVYESKRDSAINSVALARASYVEEIVAVRSAGEEAVHKNADAFFSNPNSSSPQLNLPVRDSSARTTLQFDRMRIEGVLILWTDSAKNFNAEDDLNGAVETLFINLNDIKSFLERLSLVINSLEPSSSLPSATLDLYRQSISTARGNVLDAISSLQSKKDAYEKALAARDIAERELTLSKTGATKEDILIQEAVILEARSQIDLYNAELSKYSIRAPFSGVVADLDAEVGETVSAGSPVVSLISRARFEIEAFVPEVDIARIKKGALASVTLDAYGEDEMFAATVADIRPTATILEGVPTYLTTFIFANDDPRILSGMTANVEIIVDEKKGVLVVPQRAIESRDENKFVQALISGEVVEIEVTTGLRSAEGEIEIVSGLREGDKVLVSPR